MHTDANHILQCLDIALAFTHQTTLRMRIYQKIRENIQQKKVEAIDVKCQDDMYIHNEERTSYLEKLQFKNKERKKADIQINNREVINKRKKPG